MAALGSVPNTPEPLSKRARTPTNVTGEAGHYTLLQADVYAFIKATKQRKALDDKMTVDISGLRSDFVGTVTALSVSYNDDLIRVNADYKKAEVELGNTMVKYFDIPVNDPNWHYADVDRRDLIYTLLKEFGSVEHQGRNEPAWMQNFTNTQRRAAAVLKGNLESSYLNHCTTTAMTGTHADFLDKVHTEFKVDYANIVSTARQTTINKLLGGDKVKDTDTKEITIGDGYKKVYLKNFRIPSENLQRPEDAEIHRDYKNFIQEQQNNFHLTSATKKHPVELHLRLDYHYQQPHNLRGNLKPNGTWSQIIRYNVEQRYNLQNNSTRLNKTLSTMKPENVATLIGDLVDYPESHSHYDKAIDAERHILTTAGTVLHPPYSQSSTQYPKMVVDYDWRLSDEIYYFMVNGSQLEYMVLKIYFQKKVLSTSRST